ncbi:MAG: DUF1524 domain-containing protein, partial [Hyphomicrobiaceae bacterium]
GNLVLGPRNLNERVRNFDFDQKKQLMLETDHLPLITRSILESSAWTPHEVREREAQLFSKLGELWGLQPTAARTGANAGNKKRKAARTAGQENQHDRQPVK